MSSKGYRDGTSEGNSEEGTPAALNTGHKQTRPGGALTDVGGYLLKESRPPETWINWREVRVSPAAARHYAEELRLGAREVSLLKSVAALEQVTAEALNRLYYGSEQACRAGLHALRRKRFIVRLAGVTELAKLAVGRRQRHDNHIFALDWNGSYFLEELGADELRQWLPRRVANVGPRIMHSLGVSEIWSYLAAACRATWEEPAQSADGSWPALTPFTLSLHFTKEGPRFPGVPLDGYSYLAGRRVQSWLMRPDARACVRMQIHPYRGHPYNPHSAPAFPATSQNQYSAAFRTFEQALLPEPPPPPGGPALRIPGTTVPSPLQAYHEYLFVEMETGRNSADDIRDKMRAWRRLAIMPNVFEPLYGMLPRLLIVCRTQQGTEKMAAFWRREASGMRDLSVIVTSLELLGRACHGSQGRRGLLDRVWCDALTPNGAEWVPLATALGLHTRMERVRQYLQLHPGVLHIHPDDQPRWLPPAEGT